MPQPHTDGDLLSQLHFVPGLREILLIRQVHALEHATVWVLAELERSPQLARRRSAAPNAARADHGYGGLSTATGFYLYGEVSTHTLQRAVRIALHRLVEGDWNLAIHPRCGTNLSVGMTLTAGLAFGLHLLLPKGPIEQLVGFGVATAAAAQLAPELGAVVQRHVTTAIPFNLGIDEIVPLPDPSGQPTHFVRIHWQPI